VKIAPTSIFVHQVLLDHRRLPDYGDTFLGWEGGGVRFWVGFCGLVVRVSDYRYKGPGFDPRRYQIFWVVVGLERGPLGLVRSIEELLEWKK